MATQSEYFIDGVVYRFEEVKLISFGNRCFKRLTQNVKKSPVMQCESAIR